MAIELPGAVADFLSLIGVNWPQVNEDRVREFAGHVRAFAAEVDGTHQAATATLKAMGQSYQGASYELLASKWASLSTGHMHDLQSACGVLAGALDAAADYIVGMKLQTIGELTGMAVEFAADQAAAIETLGASEALAAAVAELASQVVDGLENQLIQYITARVLDAALTPLIGVIERAVAGMSYSALEGMLGVSGDTTGAGFMIHPDGLRGHATAFRGHADHISGQADTFTQTLSGMSFT